MNVRVAPHRTGGCCGCRKHCRGRARHSSRPEGGVEGPLTGRGKPARKKDANPAHTRPRGSGGRATARSKNRRTRPGGAGPSTPRSRVERLTVRAGGFRCGGRPGSLTTAPPSRPPVLPAPEGLGRAGDFPLFFPGSGQIQNLFRPPLSARRYRSPTRIPSFVSRIQTPAASSSGRRKRCNDSHMVWACFRYPERRADLMAADARRILSSKTREPRFRVDCPGVNATREEKPPAGGGRGPGTLRKGFEAGWNPGRGWDDTPAVGSRGTRDAAGSPSASRENRSGEACALVHAGSVAAALTLASALGRTAASRRRPPAPSCCGWRRDGGAGEQPGEGASWTARSRTDRVDQLVGAEHPRWRGPRWWTSPVRRGLGPAPQRGKEPRLSRLA